MSAVPNMFEPTYAVLCGSTTAAILYGIRAKESPGLPRTILKTGSTLLLALFASLRGGPGLLVAALILGATGDAFLASDDGDTGFLCGLASFLVAHILYIWLFYQGVSPHGLSLSWDWRGGMAIVMAIMAVGFMVLLIPRVDKELRVPVFIYSLTILTMVEVALASDEFLISIGAIVFAVSDAILAVDRFLVASSSRHRTWMPYAVWILYFAGQLLIASGAST